MNYAASLRRQRPGVRIPSGAPETLGNLRFFPMPGKASLQNFARTYRANRTPFVQIPYNPVPLLSGALV